MRKIYTVILALVAGLLIAGTVVYAGQNQHSPFPPQFKVYKDREKLQRAGETVGKQTWHFYSPDDGRYFHNTYYTNREHATWPEEDITKANRLLHVRIGHRDRPDVFFMKTYPTTKEEGKGQRLDYRWVHEKRDGKGVAWSAYFKLKIPNRGHKIHIYAQWKENPETKQSYGIVNKSVNLRAR